MKTAELLKEVEELERFPPNSEDCGESPELSVLRTTNAKLQYQILHLKRVCLCHSKYCSMNSWQLSFSFGIVLLIMGFDSL